jgi:hypothetical protein
MAVRGETAGRPRGEHTAVSGENPRPPTGRSSWPLTNVTVTIGDMAR